MRPLRVDHAGVFFMWGFIFGFICGAGLVSLIKFKLSYDDLKSSEAAKEEGLKVTWTAPTAAPEPPTKPRPPRPKKASELARPVSNPEWRPLYDGPSKDKRWFEGETGTRATFEYVDGDGVVSEREVRNWESRSIYINAYCLLRRRTRTFRKDRIENWDASSE